MQNVVDQVIRNAFRDLIRMEEENGDIKLIYPQLRNGHKRQSEQEFKQLFIDHFCKTAEGLKYSVETPTRKKYSSENGRLVEKKDGESGRIDMCIYQRVEDKWQRWHMLELKAHNVKEEKVRNDLTKLIKDAEIDKYCKESYFIHILYSANKGTLNSLQKKYKSYLEGVDALLPPPGKEIIIYLLFVHGVDKGKEPCYCRFSLKDGLNNWEFQKI